MLKSRDIFHKKILVSLALQMVVNSLLTLPSIAWPTTDQEQKNFDSEFSRLLAEFKVEDTCRTFYTSALHGYDIQEHRVETRDGYELALHRVIHPSDHKTRGPRPGTKKPYLLLHGLIGSSASFVRSIDAKYKAPNEVFDVAEIIDKILKGSNNYEKVWLSTADTWHASHDGDTSHTLDNLTAKERLLGRSDKIKRPYAALNEIEYDEDAINFGPEFRQAYRKFYIPRDAKRLVTNSLAFTLSNFGYDVWLLNLRGNQYSRRHRKVNAERNNAHGYWNFSVDDLIRQDLATSIDHVRQVAQSDKYGPCGLISYSYSSMLVLGLLTKLPSYQKQLQPVIMMAPTMFTSTGGKTRYLMKLSSKFVSHNGPFPALGRGAHDKMMKLVCSLPLASKLCRLLEMVLYGQSKSVKNFLVDDQKSSMVKRDVDCGQTSTAVLHQILKNLSQTTIMPDYKPFLETRLRQMKGERVRRSVILVHSESDEISSLEEVAKIRDSAVNLMTLADYVIKDPNFGHTDFLFSQRNQYMVNGEIVRMAALYDYLMHSGASNQPMTRLRARY